MQIMIKIPLSNQLALTHLKIRLPTNYWFTIHMNNPLTVCKQISSALCGLVGTVYANGPGPRGSIPGRVLPKTLKMVLDTSAI